MKGPWVITSTDYGDVEQGFLLRFGSARQAGLLELVEKLLPERHGV
jgi:hypothetical protein